MPTVLVVEDERLTREGICKRIPWDSLGIDMVLSASTGREGLSLVKKHTPQILITDVKMPHMNGIEMAEKIRVMIPDIKLIFLSGYADKAYLKSAIKLKAIDYVEKPLDPEELTGVIQRAIKELPLFGPEESDELLHSLAEIPHPVIQSIYTYVRSHYLDTIHLSTLTTLTGLSETYLCNLFKERTGLTITEAVNRYRIGIAKELLRSGNRTVADIADLSGFGDARYFTRIFKRITGTTPGKFRQGHGQ